jgi:anti-anti-sigma factor
MTQLGEQSTSGAIRVEADGPDTCVRLIGEIDSALRQQASDSMGLALMSGQPVLLDAREATFIDSSGLAFVLQLTRATAEAEVDLRLRDPSGVVGRALEIAGVPHAIRAEQGPQG